MDNNAVYNACISRFTLSALINVGVDEAQAQANPASLLVYPNPNDGQFQVIVNSTAKNKQIEVYNTLGQLIQAVELDDNLQSQSVSLNLSEQATGVYFIVLKDSNGLCSKKVIKQ